MLWANVASALEGLKPSKLGENCAWTLLDCMGRVGAPGGSDCFPLLSHKGQFVYGINLCTGAMINTSSMNLFIERPY